SHLDPLAIGRLAAAAIGMNVTVHRVIDRTGDPLAELASLLRIKGVGSVLSSGGRATAEEGAGILQQMVQLAGERIEVIAAGKITPENLHRLHGMIQAPAYHGRKIV
ncbi:MAG: copper homeostasis protein CutC, partial [Bacteroidota bacterium]